MIDKFRGLPAPVSHPFEPQPIEVGSPRPAGEAIAAAAADAAATDAIEPKRTNPFSFLGPVGGRVFQRSAAPTPFALEALSSATKTTGEYILFVPPQNQAVTRGLIFLGGAKVQEEAYAPLAKALAERGIATAIVRSPFDLPFLISLRGRRIDEATKALRELDPSLSLMVGGHSAGGFVATRLRNVDADDVLLLNARTTGAPRADTEGLAIFGGQDGLIDAGEREETQQVLPSVATVVIDDLDHDFAQGLFGAQGGDPVTDASPQALVDQVADIVAERLGRVEG
jgi:pimeloyl-ACP methyl ester carboxylesterase